MNGFCVSGTVVAVAAFIGFFGGLGMLFGWLNERKWEREHNIRE